MLENLALIDYRNIYRMISEAWREEVFFKDNNCEQIERCVYSASFKDIAPFFYFEIPLMGKKAFDIILQYRGTQIYEGLNCCTENIARGLDTEFTKAARPNLVSDCLFNSEYFKWASQKENRNQLTLMEFDTSDGKEKPNIYTLPFFSNDKANADLCFIGESFTKLGYAGRISNMISAFEKTPERWIPYYSIVFSQRDEAVTRLSFILKRGAEEAYYYNPELLLEDLETAGYHVTCEKISQQLCDIASKKVTLEIMLDQDENGDIGDILGISMCPVKTVEKTAEENKNIILNMADTLIEWGASDERFYRAGDISFKQKRLMLYKNKLVFRNYSCFFNSLKMKWDKEKILSAKFYMMARSWF